MQRETITIETPADKHVVVLKAYVTGREQRALSNIMVRGMKNMKVSTVDQGINVPEMDTNLLDQAENEGWRTVIVSIDGHKEGEDVGGKPFSIVDTVLDMKIADYETVKAKVTEITNDRQFEIQKKISSPNTASS